MKFANKNNSNVNPIIIFGVGGAGCSIVNNICHKGITGVDFIACDTDKVALDKLDLPNKIQLPPFDIGETDMPLQDSIKKIISINSKIVLVIAGFGGNTGTQAAPIIASVARALNQLTVGFVTLPFSSEGEKRISNAVDGITEMRQNVNTLFVFNNEILNKHYGHLQSKEAFAKVNLIPSVLINTISAMITDNSPENFKDVQTLLSEGGAVSRVFYSAEDKIFAIDALEQALFEPLFNDNYSDFFKVCNIISANQVLVYLLSKNSEIPFNEIKAINDFILEQTETDTNIMFKHTIDSSLGDNYRVVVIATGINISNDEKEIESFDDENTVKVLPEICHHENVCVLNEKIREEKHLVGLMKEEEPEFYPFYQFANTDGDTTFVWTMDNHNIYLIHENKKTGNKYSWYYLDRAESFDEALKKVRIWEREEKKFGVDMDLKKCAPMTLREKLAYWVLDNVSPEQLFSFRLGQTMIDEGYNTESIKKYAGLSMKKSPLELERFLKEALHDLSGVLPTKEQAVFIMIHYLANQIIKENIDTIDGIGKIMSQVIEKGGFYYCTEEPDGNGFRTLIKSYVDEKLDFDHIHNTQQEYLEIYFWDKYRLGRQENEKMMASLQAEIIEELKKWVKTHNIHTKGFHQ